MRFLTVPLSILVIVFGLFLAPQLAQRWEQDNQHQQELDRLNEQRQQTELELWQARQQATLPSKIIADYGIVLLLFIGAGGILWIGRDFYLQRRTPLARFDAERPLVSRRMLELSDDRLLAVIARAVELSGQAQIARAEHQPNQQPTHYAPHITVHQPKATPPAFIDAPALLAESEAQPALPDVTDLANIARDFRPSKDAILLALGDGGERLTAPVSALCHVALCGATGQGKSNLLRLLLPQLQAIGARVVLTDPHYADIDPDNGDDWRAIRQRLYMPPAVKPRDIDAMLDYMCTELDRRLELRNKGEKVGAPLFLAYDELPVIVDTVKDAPERLGRILREGRKVAILTVGASQEFLVKTIGGSSGARDQYRTAYYVGGDRTSASALLDLPARTIDDGPLGHGVALLRSKATPAARLVRVPLASNQGIALMLGAAEPGLHPGLQQADSGLHLATNDRPFGFQATASHKPDVSQMEASADLVSTASASPEAARAMQLFMQGLDLAAIVLEMRGIKSTQGRRYQQAAEEIQQLLREAMTGATC
jgi:hypothetical protein